MNATHRLGPHAWLAGVALLLASAAAAAQDDPLPPGEPMRHALLIGVTDYQPDGYDNSNRARKKLSNLVTPCTDVERIGARLEQLGWQGQTDARPEVEVLCNARADVIDARLEDLVDRFDDPRKFLFVYLAGHGAQIGSRTYLFGEQAELDLDHAERRLSQSATNILFQAQSVELVADLFARANYADFKGNVLLALDSCRDDPLYTSIRIGANPLTAPLIDADSAGIIVLYATTPGRRVSDGNGTSAMADTLVDMLQPNLPVDRVVGDTIREVRERTRLTRVPQKPERDGSLNDSSLCFACATPVVAAPSPAPVLAWRPRLHRRATPAFDQEPPMAEASAPVAPVRAEAAPRMRSHKFANVFEQAALPEQSLAEPMRIDVYWCEDSLGGGEQEQRAEAFVQRLRESGTERATGGALLSDVRLRALTVEENARVQFGVDQDLVRYDADSASEEAWARRLGQVAGQPLALRADRSNTLGKVSLFFCAGSHVTAKAAGKLWVQVATPAQRGIGLVLADRVRRGVESLWVESEIEVVESSPDDSQVRYFHAGDAALAGRIADRAAERLAVRPSVQYLPMYADKVEPGKFELWVGKRITNEALLDAMAY